MYQSFNIDISMHPTAECTHWFVNVDINLVGAN